VVLAGRLLARLLLFRALVVRHRTLHWGMAITASSGLGSVRELPGRRSRPAIGSGWRLPGDLLHAAISPIRV
jgi:hypothetical protein